MLGFGFRYLNPADFSSDITVRLGYLGLAAGLMSNKELYHESFNTYLTNIKQLMTQLDTVAIRQGRTWEYRYAVTVMLSIFNAMPYEVYYDDCEGRSLRSLNKYVKGRDGSTARQDLRQIIKLITNHTASVNDQAIMEKAVGLLGRWYRARSSTSWKNFLNALVLKVMNQSLGQEFYADMQDELMDSYITWGNFRDEDHDAVCTRLFTDHCRAAAEVVKRLPEPIIDIE